MLENRDNPVLLHGSHSSGSIGDPGVVAGVAGDLSMLGAMLTGCCLTVQFVFACTVLWGMLNHAFISVTEVKTVR
jgi:hypothetical protein